MAQIANGSIGGTGYGAVDYYFYAEQTAGSGNTRTIKLTLALKVNGNPNYPSYYGYNAWWWGWCGTSSTSGTWSEKKTLKGTEYWYTNDAWRYFNWTHTINVGTTAAKNIYVGFEIGSGDGAWNFSETTWTFGVNATNRAPSAPTSITVRATNSSGSVLSAGQISEKTSAFHIRWDGASDPDKDTLSYDLQEQINSGSWKSIYTGTNSYYLFNNTGEEGTTYRYCVQSKDGKGGSSSWYYSGVFTKNKFTEATLATSTSSITNDTASIGFTWTAAANTQSGITTTYNLTCSNSVTIYNLGDMTSRSKTINIVKGTNTSTGAYIKYDDIKKAFSNTTSKGKGNLTFTLTSTNSNGTSKTKTVTISVNLQSSPTAATNLKMSESSAYSTCLTKVGATYYYIPNGTKKVRVTWTLGSGKLGEAIKQELYVSYDSGSTWSLVATLSDSQTYYDHVPPAQTSKKYVNYKIRTISSYNTSYFSDCLAAATNNYEKAFHYYKNPTFSQGTIIRNTNNAEVQVTVSTNTSIPNTTTKGTWYCYKKGTTTPIISQGTLTATNLQQKLIISNLTEVDSYDLKIKYNDSTGLISDITASIIRIGVTLPIFFVNKYGIGINGVQATSSRVLNVKGDAYIDGCLSFMYNKPAVQFSSSSSSNYYGTAMLLDNYGSECLGFLNKSTDTTFKFKSGFDYTAFTKKDLVGMTDADFEIAKGYCKSGGEMRAQSFSVTGVGDSDGAIFKNLQDATYWNSFDLYRTNSRARYGIGNHLNSAGPSIECWVGEEATGPAARLDIGEYQLAYFHTGGSKQFTVWPDYNSHGGLSIGGTAAAYLRFQRGAAQIMVRNYKDNLYAEIIASSFTQGSKREFKQNIEELDGSVAKDIVMNNDIRTYNLKQEVRELKEIDEEAQELGYVLDDELLSPNQRAGLILEDLTPEADNLLHPKRTEGVDIYAMTSVLWKFCQEQQKEIEILKEKLGIDASEVNALNEVQND